MVALGTINALHSAITSVADADDHSEAVVTGSVIPANIRTGTILGQDAFPSIVFDIGKGALVTQIAFIAVVASASHNATGVYAVAVIATNVYDRAYFILDTGIITVVMIARVALMTAISDVARIADTNCQSVQQLALTVTGAGYALTACGRVIIASTASR